MLLITNTPGRPVSEDQIAPVASKASGAWVFVGSAILPTPAQICHACAIMMAILPSQNAVGQAQSAGSSCLVSPFWDHTGKVIGM